MFRKMKLEKEEREELVKLRKDKIDRLEKDIQIMRKMVISHEKVLLQVIEKVDDFIKGKIDKRLDEEIDKTLDKIEHDNKLKNDNMFS